MRKNLQAFSSHTTTTITTRSKLLKNMYGDPFTSVREFCKIGLLAWRQYALQTKGASYRESITHSSDRNNIEIAKSFHIDQTIHGIPIIASVFFPPSSENDNPTVEPIPLTPPTLSWCFAANILIPVIDDNGYCTVIGSEKLFSEWTILNEDYSGCDGFNMENFRATPYTDRALHQKIFSSNKPLQQALQSNNSILNALKIIGERNGFKMIRLISDGVTLHSDGIDTLYHAYSLSIDSCDYNIADFVDWSAEESKLAFTMTQSPPDSTELIAAYFIIITEVLKDLQKLGVTFRHLDSI